MGGRGTHSGFASATNLPTELPYNVASYAESHGGATYPFFEPTNRAWHLLTRPVDSAPDYHSAHTFGQTKPTLRWVNDAQVNDLYVNGMTTEQFLTERQLRLDLHKGGFVLSKRLSRIMRPHFLSGFFSADPKGDMSHSVAVAYMQQSDDEAKVWDGAAVISRAMLERISLDDTLSPRQREQLARELQHAERVEFTLLSGRGEDKGHAIIADNLRDDAGNPIDFLLPQDTKREVQLGGDHVFVGISPIHGKKEMRLDIQSLINLYPFFQPEQLLQWLDDEGKQFVQAIETGEVADVMGKLDSHTTSDDLATWPLREYFARGGHPMWFRAHIKSLIGQHLKRLNHQQLHKMRLPIPGCRQYVMPAAVGKRAGLDVAVGRGEIQIDPQRGTAWVNDDDWLALQDSATDQGIADILGGADNDDALWLHPFTDHDGEHKVLAWRSPNQLGEYVILQPTAKSAEISWTDATGEQVLFPQADSRLLAQRIDETEASYLGLVSAETGGGLGEGETYSVDVMEKVAQRAVANAGALGLYCNSLMLNKALFGTLPDNPPAPLEEIIDGAVKTGADLSAVVRWNYDNSRRILEQRTPMPDLLTARLSIDRTDPDNRPPAPRRTDEHWLAQLQAGIEKHIAHIQAEHDRLVAQAQPPLALFDTAFADAEAWRLGRGLNQAFAAALNTPVKRATITPLERAKTAAEAYLAHFPPDRQSAILQGALASIYFGDNPSASDAATWLAGEKGMGADSIAQRTMKGLTATGLLDELHKDARSWLRYPNAEPLPTPFHTLEIEGVNSLNAFSQSTSAGLVDDVVSFGDAPVSIRHEFGRAVVYGADDRCIGILSKRAIQQVADGARLRLHGGTLANGLLRVITSPLPNDTLALSAQSQIPNPKSAIH